MSITGFCGDCVFHDGTGQLCRRHAPVRLPRRFKDTATPDRRERDEELIWGWPRVRPVDWCGEFERE